MCSKTNALGIQKFKTVKSEIISLKYKDIDTDMIIPAEYLKTTTKTGLWKYAFINMKKAYSDFPEFWKKEIIVAGKNFWCGSSREHAPWALLDIWIKVIISSEFADIFKLNSEKNWLLLITLEEEKVQEIMNYSWIVEVNLEKQEITIKSPIPSRGTKVIPFYKGDEQKIKKYTFEINKSVKQKLINWLDDLDYILQFRKDIKKFNKN